MEQTNKLGLLKPSIKDAMNIADLNTNADLIDDKFGLVANDITVASNRIDTIVSSICHIGRSNVASMIKNKEIVLNYDYLKDGSYKLKDNDVFSIKRVGKFVYSGVLKYTKSNHMIIEIKKYL